MRFGAVLLLAVLIVITPLILFFAIQYVYARFRGKRSWIAEFWDIMHTNALYSPPRF